MKKELTDAMFLCDGMKPIVAEIREHHAQAIRLAEKTNTFANEWLFKTSLSKQNRQQVIVSALLPRLLTAFQACLLVGERGLSAEAILLARKVLEVTFRIVAVAKSDEIAIKYVQADKVSQQKLLKKLKSLRTIQHTAEESEEFERLHAKASAVVIAEGVKEVSTRDYAESAGMLDFYDSAYAYFSQSAHTNVRDLESLVEKGTDGEIEAIRYGPDPDRLSDVLCAAIDFVTISLDAAFKVLPDGDAEMLADLRAELDLLYIAIEKNEP
jgi:hypothetical protein